MALKEYTYKITVIVEHENKVYTKQREDLKQGCNHVDNIEGTASYMAREIRKEIKDKTGL